MKPTKEQSKAVKAFSSGHNVRVIAYAGAGKTSTLTQMAKADKGTRGIYVAFNKRIAEEAAEKFPYNVSCKTAHSLAFREIRQTYDADKMTTWPKLREANIPNFASSDVNSREIVANTLRRFMMSRNRKIAVRHVPNLERMGFKDDEIRRILPAAVAETTRVWQRMSNPRDNLGLGHDGYLKLWQLSEPNLATDVLFVDEAQDLNPVLLDVIDRQRCQVVAVGDSHQQIYEWRGAVDALEEIEGVSCRLTQSFRFGPSIAAAANRILTKLGEEVPLRGSDKADTVRYFEVDDNHASTADAILCRSNGGVISNLIAALDAGRDVYVAGGVQQLVSLVDDARRLQQGQPPSPGELMGFTTWKEVIDFSDEVEGASLKVFVNLVEKYGPETLLTVLRRVRNSPTPHCVTISTTHKGKGLEWNSVRVDDDFLLTGEAKKVTAAQLRLLYVAMTRAKSSLILPEGIINQYEKAEVQ